MTAEGWHHDFRASGIRHEPTVFRSNTKGIRKVNIAETRGDQKYT